jgi:hypothetical protein
LGSWSEERLAFIQAGAVGIVTLLGAVAGAALSGKYRTWVVIVTSLVVIVVLAFLSRYVVMLRDRLVNKRKSDMEFVHEQLSGSVMKEQEELETSDEKLVLVRAAPVQSIDRVAALVHNLLEARYQEPTLPGEPTYFEVVVMTTSFLDQGITIAAWANSDQRQPTSLSTRTGRPDAYDQTVTADIYRESESKRPEPRLIPDTSVPGSYHHLYPSQKQRIKSTIAYPILSSRSNLLATLVVSADQPNLFTHEDERFWRTVLSFYERRIGLELLRLTDAVHHKRMTEPF